jgi:cytochrome c-type biogenesis protein CcmH
MKRLAMARNSLSCAILAAAALVSFPALAVEPDEMLGDAALEARAMEISRVLRCVVCQSQNIDDSNAPLARDMRLIVRERLVAGDSDEEVMSFLVARYGDYVLLKPPVQPNTIFLWLAPLFVLAAGGTLAAFHLARVGKIERESADGGGLETADEPRTLE